jgi:hypothetical protein
MLLTTILIIIERFPFFGIQKIRMSLAETLHHPSSGLSNMKITGM